MRFWTTVFLFSLCASQTYAFEVLSPDEQRINEGRMQYVASVGFLSSIIPAATLFCSAPSQKWAEKSTQQRACLLIGTVGIASELFFTAVQQLAAATTLDAYYHGTITKDSQFDSVFIANSATFSGALGLGIISSLGYALTYGQHDIGAQLSVRGGVIAGVTHFLASIWHIVNWKTFYKEPA